ncbi:MAG TPA: nucleoid-associated protein [Paludibacter sp.]
MARIDYSLLVIDKLIIHDVPKHKKDELGAGPNYSENESTITDGLRVFFQDKIKAALNSDQSIKVCFKEETDSSVPLCAHSIINSDDDFVKLSKDIATNLYNIQKGNNAAGILLILKGRISTLTICVILKLERDNGAQLVLNAETKTFNVEEVHDLMLTKKTKIFKVTLFINRSISGTDYDGQLMDYQINPKNKKEINTFFLDFMGCIPYADPKISTKRFYNLTREFIDTIPNLIQRSQYIQDLNSYLRKNQATINPREFAEDYMTETQHKNQYRDYLLSKGFEFTTYTKDTILVNSHISRILVEFENGISILGTDGTFEDKVLLTEDEQTGECKAEIKSKIKNIK